MAATPDQTAGDLDRRLGARGHADKQAWWERYLKGEAVFHGVPIATVRDVVWAWYVHHQLVRPGARGGLEHVRLAVRPGAWVP